MSRSTLNSLLTKHQSALELRETESKNLALAEDELFEAEEARDVVQSVGQLIQQEVHKRVSDLVTRCLQVVFDETYEFRFDFDRKRNKTQATPVLVRDGVEVDPMSASGGGVVDVIAFGLRLSGVLLTRPPLRRLLVLDEPFRFVSAEYRPRVRQLVELLSKETGVQVVMVTHIDHFRMGTEVKL